MFYAMLLVCSLQQGAVPPCVRLEDDRGPYETQELCKARVDEMAGTLTELFAPPYTVKFKCAEEKITRGLST